MSDSAHSQNDSDDDGADSSDSSCDSSPRYAPDSDSVSVTNPNLQQMVHKWRTIIVIIIISSSISSIKKFKKVVTMTSLALKSCQSKLNTQWVSLKRFIDGHGHNNDTFWYEQWVEQRYSVF